jgi:hypothetical protein
LENVGEMYRAAVTYRYEVDGEELLGCRVRFGDSLSFGWASPARGIVKRYTSGRQVTVRYDPNKPKDSVLEPGFNSFLLLELVIGCLVFALLLLTR